MPPAFDPEVDKRVWYRALAVVSFVGVSGGLVAAATAWLGRHGPVLGGRCPRSRRPATWGRRNYSSNPTWRRIETESE